MSLRRPSRTGLLADESGYTLIELLVAMISALVVTSAAFTLLEFTTNILQQTDDRIDSAISGGAALTAIVQGLESSCIFPATSPIQSTTSTPSSSTSLTFWSNSTGGGATVTPVLRDIKLTGSNLTETRYALASGTTPSTWTFSSSGTTTTLASHISEVSGTPVFQYYYYSGGEQQYSLTGSQALTAAQAANVVNVAIEFSAAPYNTSTKSTQTTRQTVERRTVGLRLSPFGSTATNVACQ